MTNKKKYIKSFEDEARKIHGNTYDYLGHDDLTDKEKMYCHVKDNNGKEHGLFMQNKYKHLKGQGCPICRYLKSAKHKQNSLDKLKEDIEKLKQDKNYSYDFESYTKYSSKFKIYCHNTDSEGNEHGWFSMTPYNFIHKKQNCPKCGRENTINSHIVSEEKFLERANKLHNRKFRYGIFPNKMNEKMEIICPIHGSFFQTPSNHLQGQGCPYCKESKLEIEIKQLLEDNHIEFIRQYKTWWLGKLSLDFYLPNKFIGIECQGKQHFNMGGWDESFDIIKERDERKLKLCQEHNIKLLYFSNLGIEYPYHVFEDKNLLLEEIIK